MRRTRPPRDTSFDPHEQHLLAQGFPLMVAPSVRARETLRRSAWVSAMLAVGLTGTSALDKANDVALERLEAVPDDAIELQFASLSDPIVLLLLLAAALVVAAPLVGWAVAALVRRVGFTTGTAVGVIAALNLVLVPVVSFDGHDGPSVWTTAGLALAVLAGTYLGAGTLVRWSARRVVRETGTMGPMIARVLPLLMLATVFFFFTAEIWQLLSRLSWGRTAALAAVMAAAAVLLVVVIMRDELRRDLADGAPVEPALRPAEKLNLLLIPVLATLIQTALFATVVFAFFLFLGWLAIPAATETAWTELPVTRPEGLLAALPLSTTQIRAALMLAAFSALNLVASAASDAAHRERFVRPMIDEVVDGLGIRHDYLAARGARGSLGAAGGSSGAAGGSSGAAGGPDRPDPA